MRIIDACVHPFLRNDRELVRYLPKAMRERTLPGIDSYQYLCPGPEYVEDDGGADHPGSDPKRVVDRILTQGQVDQAILVPLTRGCLGDPDLWSAACSATNDWLAAEWLGAREARKRFRGTIRVNPDDVEAAVREVERWASNDSMVQIAVPLQVERPYGDRRYHRLWECAADRGLPVLVHADGGRGNHEFWPTEVGYPRFYTEYGAIFGLNYVYHLVSLVMQGVFERLQGLVFVFGDGGYSMLMPAMWHLDKDWRSLRRETPWVKRLPSLYLQDHVRFLAQKQDEKPEAMGEWLGVGHLDQLVMYASDYPYWDFYDPQTAYVGAPPTVRERVLGANAAALYRL